MLIKVLDLPKNLSIKYQLDWPTTNLKNLSCPIDIHLGWEPDNRAPLSFIYIIKCTLQQPPPKPGESNLNRIYRASSSLLVSTLFFSNIYPVQCLFMAYADTVLCCCCCTFKGQTMMTTIITTPRQSIYLLVLLLLLCTFSSDAY